VPVSFGLANFTTGELLPDLPVTAGCTWASILGGTDTLEAKVDIRDDEVPDLELMSLTEPKKTVLFAEVTGRSGTFLAIGLIGERSLDGDIFSIPATGLRYYWSQRIVGPPAARTTRLTNPDGSANPALDIELNGRELGSIGVDLMRLALTWPGAQSIPFVLPTSRTGTNYRKFSFLDLTAIGDALNDLSGVIDGPDFAFEGRRVADTSTARIEYPVRAGTTESPLIGRYVGSWPFGGPTSPVVSFPFADDAANIASAAWATAGRTDSKVLASRKLNPEVLAAGYAPFDVVDTSHTDVSVQETLDGYAQEAAFRGLTFDRSFTLKVRGDTRVGAGGMFDENATPVGPMLGDYRPGDYVAVDVIDHPLLPDGLVDLRILSMQGDETGDVVELDVMVVK
jgi:hypothetical protein